jgi:hypothetical protein
MTNVTADTSDYNTTSDSYNNIGCTTNESDPVLHNNDTKMWKTRN